MDSVWREAAPKAAIEVPDSVLESANGKNWETSISFA